MPISVNPTVPVITAQGAVSGVVLQPGTVINAQVLKILADDLVQIAIANLSIDVLSEIPLQAGQNLQLAVSQTQDGIRLAVVGQGAAAAPAPRPRTPSRWRRARPLHPPRMPRRGKSARERSFADQRADPAGAIGGLRGGTDRGDTAGKSRAAVRQSRRRRRQSGGLPPALQQAVAQVLAQRSSLDQNLTGSDVKNAFESSGLFLEASLASGSASTASGLPDLKAALIVLRQTLLSSLGTADSPAATATGTPQPAVPQSAVPAFAGTAASNEVRRCRMPRLWQQRRRHR